jgi:hypothetical protein
MVGDVSNHISFRTSSDDVGYAVVQRSEVNGDIHWSGKSCAVSMNCDAIYRDDCTLGRSNVINSTRTFSCSGILDEKNRTAESVTVL